MKRFIFMAVILGSLVALAAPAMATPPGGNASGGGDSNGGASFGFNAGTDLKGNFELHTPTGIDLHCHGYDTYVARTTAAGYPDARFTSSNCRGQGQDTNTYKIKVDASDRSPGNSGPHDHIWITVRLSDNTKLYFDRGPISNGNIGITV